MFSPLIHLVGIGAGTQVPFAGLGSGSFFWRRPRRPRPVTIIPVYPVVGVTLATAQESEIPEMLEAILEGRRTGKQMTGLGVFPNSLCLQSVGGFVWDQLEALRRWLQGRPPEDRPRALSAVNTTSLTTVRYTGIDTDGESIQASGLRLKPDRLEAQSGYQLCGVGTWMWASTRALLRFQCYHSSLTA